MFGSSLRAGIARCSGLKWNQPRIPTSNNGSSLRMVSRFCTTLKVPMPRRLIRVHSQIAAMATQTINSGSASAGMNTRR